MTALLRETAEVARATIRGLLVDSATAAIPEPGSLPVVNTADAVAVIASLLRVEIGYPGPSIAYLSREAWAARCLDGLQPTLRPLAEMWSSGETGDPEDRESSLHFGRVFGPLVGGVVADLAGRALGDFDVQLPGLVHPEVVALPAANLVEFASAWNLPLPSVVRWAFACSVVRDVLMRDEVVGSTASRLALRYRLEIGTYPEGAFGQAVASALADGPVDMNHLMQARTPRQHAIIARLSVLSAMADSVGLLAWRMVDPDHDEALESHLVEALRRRRANLSRSQMVAEFWLGVPLGPVINDEVDRFVRAAADSSGGLSAMCSGDGAVAIPGGALVSAGDSPIPGRPRTASLWPTAHGPVLEDEPDLLALETKLGAVLSRLTDPAAADVVRGRIAGLHVDVADRTAAALPAGSPGYRTGMLTSWLQMDLVGHGVDLNGHEERRTAIYAFVVGSEQNAQLLRSSLPQDLLRLHTRAIIQVERKDGEVTAGVELALFHWLAGLMALDPGLETLASWHRTRAHRLRMSKDGLR